MKAWIATLVKDVNDGVKEGSIRHVDAGARQVGGAYKYVGPPDIEMDYPRWGLERRLSQVISERMKSPEVDA